MSFVRMVRNPEQHNAPHSADVHESEVAAYRKGGYVLPSEATFPVAEQQHELPLTPGASGTAQLGSETGEPAKPAEQSGGAGDGWGKPAS